MLRGVTSLTLDGKGRMAIPTRYREELARYCEGRMVLTVDRDHCLLLYPLPEWEEIERKLVQLPSLNPQTRSLQRLLIGHATECEMDGSGRILLPPPLRGFASLEKDIVLIGQGNKFEIWDEQQWNARRTEWLAEVAVPGGLAPELESLSL
ncbi:MAG TPA: division/cell wall cluster transcriptional repressor MraZ [Acidiferrobacteraceae bacterium]|nr:division/cell wall cluster transcriptional repressor MraZ [Acidiferrobacteraceae bacterium]